MSDDVWDLEALAAARGLGDWQFAQAAPFARGTVAEVGAGIGTFSERLLGAGVDRLLLVEPEAACVTRLRERFGPDPRVTIAAETLPGSPALAELGGSCDLVLCQNVLEHIADDGGALRAMRDALSGTGVLLVLVPAHPRLFGALDRAYGHERRYTRERLVRLAGEAGLEVVDVTSFNALGILGWWTKTRFSPQPRLDPRSLRMYERLLRVWRPLEDRMRPRLRVGLSLILVARPAAGR
jgi:SAM-dependent methyltransferase